MKYKHFFSLCAVALTLSSTAFAANPTLNQYSSTMHPQSGNVLNTLLHPPTDITVVNASGDYIYAVVPYSPVNDYLSPGFNDHIYNNDPNVWNTYLVLQDVYRNTFYATNVCRLAIVTVYGYTGNFRINVDSDLCN